MFPMRTSILLVAMLSSLVLAAEPATQPAKPPEVNEPARPAEFKTLQDGTVRLAELTEKQPVVLIVLRGWVGYQCPLCTKQVADFVAHAKKFEDQQARVVLVYPGAADDLKKHAQDFETGKQIPAGFDFVLDPDLRFVNDWGLRWKAKGETAYPCTFVIDKKGIVRFAKISHSHGDRAKATDVLKRLEEINR
jgi:peroxiredoxin